MNIWNDMIDQLIPKWHYNDNVYHNIILSALFWDMFAILLIVQELIVILNHSLTLKLIRILSILILVFLLSGACMA